MARRRAGPHPVDVHVGKQLQAQRTLCGMSQTELADKIGVTFQQLQKYERGTNRLSASRLWQFSKALGVPISHFFEGLDGKAESADTILQTRAGLELVRDYEGCSKEFRRAVNYLTRALVNDVKVPARKKPH